MEFSYDHLLERLNETIKPYGYEFCVIENEEGIDMQLFNGEDWQDFALGFYDEEMPELLFNASIDVFNRIISDIKDNKPA